MTFPVKRIIQRLTNRNILLPISHAFQTCAELRKLEEKPTSNRIDRLDVKAKAKALREIMQDLAHVRGIELRHRRKGE